jgi:osmotically-inducible protein OsmY
MVNVNLNETAPTEFQDIGGVLSGNVHSDYERAEAVELANSVSNVERVVDQIKVKRRVTSRGM